MAIALGLGSAVGVPATALAERAGSTVTDVREAGAASAVDGSWPEHPTAKAAAAEPRPVVFDGPAQGGSAPSGSAASAGAIIGLWLLVIGLCEMGAALAMRKDMTSLKNALQG